MSAQSTDRTADTRRDGPGSTALASKEYRRIAALPARQLEKLVVRGETPDVDALVGWEFRGTNTPWTADVLRIKKFVKGFYRDGTGTWGYNVPVRQNGVAAPWIERPSDDAPKRFGFFAVTGVGAEARDNAYLHALLLDYSKAGNPIVDVTKVLRDYLVRVEPGSDELLLGKAYVAVGPARVPAGYFVLERHCPSDFVR